MPRRKELNPAIMKASEELDIELFRESIKGAFVDVADPRDPDLTVYPLWYLLLIVLTGYMSGCNTIADLEAFGRLRHSWLVGVTGAATEAPSYDTIWMLLVRIKPDGLKSLIRKWFERLTTDLRDQVLALDGKRARGATYLDNVVHLVELVITETGFIITQERVPSKAGEGAALLPILDAVNVEGAILSMDALYTTKKIANLIISKRADYILALKMNQERLYDEAENFFDQAYLVKPSEAGVEVYTETRSGHGRNETVVVTVCFDLDWLPQKEEWPSLKRLVEVVNIDEAGNRTRRLYLSSREGTAEEFAKWIRSHWAIENDVHWVADVVFREDASKASVGHCQENMALFRRLVMNIIRIIDPGVGLADARRACDHSDQYRLGLLVALFGKSL